MKHISSRSSRGLTRRGNLPSMGLGALTTIGIELIGVSAFAFFAHRGMLPLSVLQIITKVFYTIAVLCGCWLAAKRTEKRKLLCAGEAGILSFLLLVGICEAAGESAPANLGLTGVLTVGAILAGGLLGARQKQFRYV